MKAKKVKAEKNIEPKRDAEKHLFLKPTIYKIIFPSIVVILMLAFLFFTYNVSSQSSALTCKFIKSGELYRNAQSVNDSIAMMAYSEDLRKYQLEMQDFTKNNIDKINFVVSLNKIIGIDPLYPVPCTISNTDFCVYYTDKATYDCLKELIAKGTVGEANIPEYRSLNVVFYIFNLIIFFILAYIISCIIAFVYRKIKRR